MTKKGKHDRKKTVSSRGALATKDLVEWGV